MGLIYIVAFPSVEAQKKAWKAFWDDPEWKKVKADAEKDGVLVKETKAKNLQATDYSPIREATRRRSRHDGKKLGNKDSNLN